VDFNVTMKNNEELKEQVKRARKLSGLNNLNIGQCIGHSEEL